MATIQTPNGVTLRVSAKTGLKGLSERTRAIIAGMAQAAPAAGIAVIDITAGKEGGHLSHAKGTEVDLKAYSADGSLWTPEQRVALAAGAQAGGADRIGLYSFGKGKLGSGTMHVGYSGPGRPAAVWGADSKVRGAASRRFTNPAEKAFLASYQNGQPFDTASLGLSPLGASQAPQTAQSAIADLIAPPGGTQVPEPPTAAMGFAPTLPELASFEPPAPAGQAPAMPMPTAPPQFAQATGFPIDEALTGASAQDVLMGGPRPSPNRPPMPASGPVGPTTAAGVLDVGPRLRPPDMFVINPVSGAPDASAVPSPNLNPRNMIASAPVGPTTPQGVLDMGPPMRPGGAPDASRMPAPPSNPRRDPFGFPIDVNRPALANGDGSISTEETTTFDAAEVGMPSEIVTVPTIIGGRRVSEDEAKAAFAAGQNPAVQRGFPSFADAETAARARTDAIPGARATGPGPFVSSFPARPEGPTFGLPPAPPFQTPFAGRPEVPGGLPAAPPAPFRPTNMEPVSAPIMADPLFNIDRELADSMDRMRSERESLNLANDIGFTRRNFIEPFQPAYRPPPPSPVEQRIDDATAPAPTITQNIPPSADGPTGNVVLPWNDHGDGRQSFIDSIPAPPPIATGTGEFGRPENYPPGAFGPPPAVPAPLAGRFSDAFGPPTAGGIITDTPALPPVTPRIAGGGDPRTNIARRASVEQPAVWAPDFSRPQERDIFSWEGVEGNDALNGPLWRTGSPLNQFRMKPEEFYDPALDRDRYFPPSPEVERNYRRFGFPQEASLQAPPAPTAMDGINALFVAPPTQAKLPELASSFAAVPKPPGIDSPLYAPVPMATAPVPLAPPPQRDWSTTPPATLGLDVAPPDPRNWAAGMDIYVQNRFPASTFAGGSVIRPPTNPMPGQPGVVQGTMPTPAGAMDIRPPAQGGPEFTPSVAPAERAPPVEAPRQKNAGLVRNGGGMVGGALGGLIAGPIGALAGGLIGRSGIFGGGSGLGFGGQPSFAWSSGGNAPYGNNGGSTTYQKGSSNALGGSNALSWQGSGGQQVTVVQDPWSGGYYGPTTTGGGLY